MNGKLEEIRKRAVGIRETLSYEKQEDQKKIAKTEYVIRGTSILKWMKICAAVFFIVCALIFMSLMYPNTIIMMMVLGAAVLGYGFSWFGIFIQIKLYDRALSKIESGA